MRKHFNSIIAIGVLVFITMACNASFSTANISSFNFGKNDKADPPTTTFNVGEKIYAVANVSNSISKQKIRFKLTFENVQGKGKGEEAATKDLDIEGSSATNFFFTPPLPGEYKVEAILLGEDGKEIDKKSGTVTVKGESTSTTEKPKTTTDDDKDKDKDTDSDDK